MSSSFKGNIEISVFGESHGNGIGIVIDNLPSDEEINMDFISTFMSRRAPKKDGTSTYRAEKDIPEIMSGIYCGKTTGTPLCAVIRNTDQHSDDYKSVSYLARPAHADYTGFIRYGGANDLRGGGHFSGRLTAPLVFAGAVCAQILERKGIVCGAHILKIKDVFDSHFDNVNITGDELIKIRNKPFPLINSDVEKEMKEVILNARENLDSVGGIVECAVTGVPVGIGSPMFDGIENRISQLMFGIPAVKGIEFGNGFECTDLFGSENNDEFITDGEQIKTLTNNHGGILGGISSGMPITLKVAFKPTPSISRPQKTVDYVKKTNETLSIVGRHDPCIVPRAVPCVESAVNIALLSLL